jgi:hypothetical protein
MCIAWPPRVLRPKGKRKRHVGGHGALGVESTSQRDSAATLPQGGAETALLIVKTPATSPGSAVRMGGGALRENPVSRKGGLPRLSKKFK